MEDQDLNHHRQVHSALSGVHILCDILKCRQALRLQPGGCSLQSTFVSPTDNMTRIPLLIISTVAGGAGAPSVICLSN